ncbi:Uncharacterized protein BP5553_06440 [Venustampulla echinocandica]|uniref:Fe2OG dioxygenase domain-containing protein n=1 Tax=Venustampulla echinocandica TaxID=2656787 RepID=A0A370TJX7_9HELO|nr:Uncharacterized protein BP5553_06440 [Venustampulla echinocandica]RDL35828.1 Uncharacterized protein BP5553_06440 [Venustampulla echinocandica]
MDDFIRRKKRRLLSPETNAATNEMSGLSAGDDESTDFKLALLSSLHPDIEQQVLLDVLLASDGSVEEASASLTIEHIPEEPRRKVSAATGYQSSLSSFVASKNASNTPTKKLLSKKGKTLHLFSPEDVAQHTPCSIIHNFLDPEQATGLLEELLDEAKTFERATFKLFENVVQSPHTNCFYVDGMEEMHRHQEYVYNGAPLTDVRQLTPEMRKVAPKVEEAVNMEIAARIKNHYPNGQKLKYQSPHRWKPNAAFANCYSGAAESVGYHSDHLTYLGPRPVIGSISLGVAREFRVRRIVPVSQNESSNSNSEKSETSERKGKQKQASDSDAEGQIAIHLPHNSLLVMHAEMQEEWKHSIAPAQAIDPHPVSGNRRINITYRQYKPSLHPKLTPKCKCEIPTVLRVVNRRVENCGKYYWTCHAGYIPGKEGCGFFEWASFDESDGEPIWKGQKDKDK